MKIQDMLFLLPSKQFGGAEKHSLDLCAAFKRRGVSVTVVCADAAPVKSKLTDGGFDWIQADIAWDDAQESHQNLRRQEDALSEIWGRNFDFALVSLPWPHYGYGLHRALVQYDLPHVLISHLAPHESPHF